MFLFYKNSFTTNWTRKKYARKLVFSEFYYNRSSTKWTKPFRIEVSQELQRGENMLEIKVVNSWFNRVAGDEIFPEKSQYTSTNAVLMHDFRGRSRKIIPLEESGLMGPVSIRFARKFHVNELSSDR